MTMRMSAVIVDNRESATALHRALIAAGIDARIDYPDQYDHDPIAFQNPITISVPCSQHREAHQILKPIHQQHRGVLAPPVARYYRTSDPTRFVRIEYAPDRSVSLVSRPEWSGIRFGAEGNPAADDVRQTAAAAGLRLRNPSRYHTEEYWYD